MTERILTYTSEHRDDVERFRLQTFAEGNHSLDHKKFDPDALNGQIWLAYVDDQLVSMSAAEVSHYTAEINVVRKCRYHILRSHRHGRYGFKFLKRMIPWCADNGYKLLYWTHDVTNLPLNALYQRKRSYAFSADNAYFNEWPYTETRFETDKLFKTGDMLQFVYSIYIDKDFVWQPRGGGHIYYYPHDGDVVKWPEIQDKALPADRYTHG